MASPQLRADVIRAYKRDGQEIRVFIAKYENRDTSFENMKSDYKKIGHNFQELLPNMNEEEAEELFSDERVTEVQDQYNDLVGVASDLYELRTSEQQGLTGGRRKRRPGNRKTLRKKRTHRRRKFLNLTLRRRVRA